MWGEFAQGMIDGIEPGGLDRIREAIAEAGRPDTEPGYEEEVDSQGNKTGRWRVFAGEWCPKPKPELGPDRFLSIGLQAEIRTAIGAFQESTAFLLTFR